jgi:hyaluronate lyase
MYNGQILDDVRGRSISRINESAAMHGVIEGVSSHPTVHDPSPLFGAVCRQGISHHEHGTGDRDAVHGGRLVDARDGSAAHVVEMARNTFDHLSEPSTLVDISLFDAAAKARPVPESSTPSYFASMDRLVHRR